MKQILTVALLWSALSVLWAANTTTSVTQVTSEVTVSDNVDYVITSTTPFTGSGKVDITNTEHAVVIIENIKPSLVIKNWLKNRVYVNGAQAVNGNNCQVKMYAQGAIILPYASNFQPLTVYSEQNYGGTSCSDFGLEDAGGFMNTLSEEKLNNKIRSFKLKRGYMVTFSTRAGGRGYSRCFIADKADLEVATLPAVLDQSISSYRVFQWYNAAKKGLASNGSSGANQALNTSWCYDWAQGNASNLPDCEWVPNHIYEDWPSPSACGSVTGSCHMKTNNEPANQSDDHPQSVETILANWENLMRTGMRLCSPSSWDGSDYWNGTGTMIKVLLDSIDARGWRCDIVDAHCYWPSGNFGNLESYWWPSYKRPIWISEWIWGASWGNNASAKGAFADGVTDAQILSTTQSILNKLNSMGCVERYAYWNSESKGHIYENGSLTALGEYYAEMKTGLGYNPAYEFIPTNPRMYNPKNLKAEYDKTTQQVTLSWYEPNGEYNTSMEVQARALGSSSWTKVTNVELQELAADYQVTVSGRDGNRYRIRVVDANGTERLTNEAYAVIDDLGYGDGLSVPVNGEIKTLYLGGNRLLNGDFLLGTFDWTNGVGEPLSAPYFQVVPAGGVNNSPYLQCYGNNSNANHAQSINKLIALQKNTSYYVGGAGSHCNGEQRIITSPRKDALIATARLKLPNVSEWAAQGVSFTVAEDTCAMVQVRSANGVAQVDELMLCPLFESAEEAQADALTYERARVDAFLDIYATEEESVLASLRQLREASTDANALEQSLQATYAAIQEAHQRAEREALTTEDERALPFAADEELYVVVTDNITNPTFASESGWETKTGTYTGGDQRLATQAGRTCWNAWWSNAVTGDAQPTLGIQQTTSVLTHGLYALEVKATTQHYCETDQHGWLYNPATGDTLLTQKLPYGNLDLPAFSNEEKWMTLYSSYTYVEEGAKLTVGFVGSKTSADNGKFMTYGKPTATPDNREGWWCATDFRLRRIPLLKVRVDATGWGTLCMPANFVVPEGVQLYESAGILADGTAIALNPVSEPVPGYPYLYHSAHADTIYSLVETGATVKTAKTNVNGFMGVLKAAVTLSYPLNSFRFVDGGFVKVTERGISVPSFSVLIQNQSKLPVLSSFDGVTVPIQGASSGIETLRADDASQRVRHDLTGRLSNSNGLVIESGKVVFVK